MMRINSYLTFNGNCREAMTFYKDCLGGELMLQPIDGSPMAEHLPPAMKACILHATLTTEDFVIMGSDMAPEAGLVKGNALSMMLNCSSEAEIHAIFAQLSEGGRVKHAIETTFWGASFGDLTDKFGHNWLLNFDKKLNQ